MKAKAIRTTGTTYGELKCAALIQERGKARIIRAGWPDFLLERKSDGRLFGVEVKSGGDYIRDTQRTCFEALERGGVPVYVWHPREPDKFVLWREFDKTRKLKPKRDFEKEMNDERYRKAFIEHQRLTGYDRAAFEELVAGGGQ